MTGGRVVILGRPAATSQRYVRRHRLRPSDPQGRLPQNLNTEMVDLEDLDDTDIEWLRHALAAIGDDTDSAGRTCSGRLATTEQSS